jgi:hypothetical protein
MGVLRSTETSEALLNYMASYPRIQPNLVFIVTAAKTSNPNKEIFSHFNSFFGFSRSIFIFTDEFTTIV